MSDVDIELTEMIVNSSYLMTVWQEKYGHPPEGMDPYFLVHEGTKNKPRFIAEAVQELSA